MTYSVLLVQRGISAGNHPVSGKSKKLYGQALQSPVHGGVAFSMSLPDYMASAHDLIGNTAANQQWVPEFISSVGPADAHRCDRCPKPATALWNNFYFCDDHAPDNATYLDGSGETVGNRKGRSSPPKPVANPPKVDESISPGVTDDKKDPELAREDMQPPSIGTEREDAERAEAGPETDAELPPLPPQMKEKPAEAKAEPAAKQPAAAPQSVTEIAGAVVEQLLPKLDTIIAAKVAAASKAVKDAKPKKKSRPESEFTKLQAQAKKLEINSFGKNAAQLRAEIAAKENR
jgi:hypothetical protein